MVNPKRIRIKEEYCIGCRLCEVYCITRKSSAADIVKIYKKGTATESGIYFEEKGSTSFAVQCRHRDDAPCLEAGIKGAMYRDNETGR
ncbi:MAG: 4Fe-4S ferredoxin, partial [bacterium]|nr:4Fe-4S ferredoxin [bacterium]